MIRLKDANLTDGLPQIIAREPWAQAMAYAVNRQLRQLLTLSAGVRLASSINTLPASILDILAVELRVPYYDQSYSVDVKRDLIRGALPYWATAGTVESLSRIMTNIFGDAEIEEWFDYGGDPGYFRILTTNQQVTGDTLAQFTKTTQDVKRLTAWLQEVLVDLTIPNMTVYHGAALYEHDDITLIQEG